MKRNVATKIADGIIRAMIIIVSLGAGCIIIYIPTTTALYGIGQTLFIAWLAYDMLWSAYRKADKVK